jgi:hypothetical protein
MKHLMIDLETMGLKPEAPIVSIGAVFFNPATGEMGQKFYTAIKLESAMEMGAIPEGDTVRWWLTQSQEAREAISGNDASDINTALIEFSSFISRNCDNPKYLKVWGNGANFDNVIIRRSYERSCLDCPWHFSGDSDVRTIVLLGRQLGFDPKRDLPFDGVAHNALADAIHQAKYVSAIWQRLLPTSTEE